MVDALPEYRNLFQRLISKLTIFEKREFVNMPTYEYECSRCGLHFEKQQKYQR
jgi:hypothetical protein